eukprot:gb/GFBE01045692.1/.p1 GENE.gb/GFBE01045692.1/~~gb/GFBE01045692.1/.p1  ORF type:complete len:147 (+),score=34.45 gb/GFBE01045692.1/:1-441(+)
MATVQASQHSPRLLLPLLSLAWLLWTGPAFVGPASSRRAIRTVAAAKAGGSDSGGSEASMTLEEEFRRGETLEQEFQKIIEARKRGADIKREPGLEAKSDLEIGARRALQSASNFASGLDLRSGVTWFWIVVIGLIVVAWVSQLLH